MAPTAKSGGRAAALQRYFATFSNGPTRGAYTEIVRNGLGARGIDYVEVFKTGSATSVRFPVYDGHGNMTACLLRDGAGGFTLTSRRAYDPWGAMRQWGTHPSGASAYQGAPSNRYVGSLGHQQDDDSGLYYMRARYYEPGSGRFISEDPAYQPPNFFAYANNDPIQNVDTDGQYSIPATASIFFAAGVALLALALYNGTKTGGNFFVNAKMRSPSLAKNAALLAGIAIAVAVFLTGNENGAKTPEFIFWLGSVGAPLLRIITEGVTSIGNLKATQATSVASAAIFGTSLYMMVVGGYLLDLQFMESGL